MNDSSSAIMMTEDYKMLLQNLEEYVIDEDKIITYKWLSKNFKLHVNTAKQLLYSFASEQKDKVYSTYLIGGLLKDGEGGSVQIVREEHINKVKREFKLVTSEHVYSVQKAKTLQDLNILYTVDVDQREEKDLKQLSSIKCDHPVLRPLEEVEVLKRKTQSAAIDANEKKWPAAKKPTDSSADKDTRNKKQAEEAENSKTISLPNGENIGNKKEQKKGGIAAMFAAQSSRPKKENNDVESKVSDTKKPKAEKGISAFFNQKADKPVTPSSPKKESKVSPKSRYQNSPKKVEVNSGTKTNINVEVNSKQEKEFNKKNIASKSKKSNEKKGDERKRKKAKVDDLQPTKKRKRIVVISDSEDSDDDIFGKEEEEDEDASTLPPLPQEPDNDGDDVIPPTPDASLKKGRKRVRKLIDKTYMDEDGYMLTRKEYVFESCTESEPEEEKEKENKSKDNGDPVKTEKASPKVEMKEPPSKKKKVSPQNTKQSSIMNFFKKK